VVDIDKHRIEAAARPAGIESISGMQHCEKVSIGEAAADLARAPANASTTANDRTDWSPSLIS
jgi:hypothetical protein